MPDSLEEKRKTDPLALRDVSVSGEDTFKGQLDTSVLNKEDMDTSVLNAIEEEAYQPSQTNINGVAIPASVMSLYREGSDPTETFKTITDEFASSGKSKTLDSVLERKNKEDQAAMLGAVQSVLLDPSSTPEQMQGVLDAYEKGINFDYNIEKEALEDLASAAILSEHNIRETSKVQEFLVNSVDRIASSRQDIRELYSKHKTDIDKSAINVFTDSFLSLLPFNYNMSVDNIIEDLQEKGTLPEGVEGSLGLDFLTPGEAIKFMRDELYSLSGQERVDFAEAVMDSVKGNAGLIGGNAAIQVQILDSVFGSFLEEATAGDDEFGRWLDNAAGILDAVSLGQALKNSIGVIRPSNSLRNIAAGSPETEASLASEILADESGKLAATFNTTKEEIAEGYVMPKPLINVKAGDTLPAVPGRVAQTLQSIQDMGTDIIDKSKSNPFFYPEAIDREVLLVDDELKAFADYETETIAKVHYNQAESSRAYNPETGMMDVQATYSKSDTHGFSSLTEAKFEAEYRTGSKYDLEYLMRDGDSLVPVPEGMDDLAPGEYFFRAKASVPINKDYVDTSKILFDPNDTHVLPFGSDFILSPEVKLPWLSRVADRATDLSHGVQGRFMQVFEKHFVKGLNAKQQKRVNHVLELGSDEGVVYSQTDLLSFDLSPREMDAYYVARQVSDVFWMLDNQQRKATLEAMDMKHIYIDDLEFEMFGKPLTSEEAGSVAHVYDPRADQVVQISRDEVEGLYASRGVIAKAEQAMGSVNKATHVILRQGDEAASNPVIGKIPERVMHYNNGQISRYYKENFFVTKKQRVMIDGVQREISVARAASTMKKDAESIAKKFTDNALPARVGEEGMYSVRPARELDVDDISRHRDQVRPKSGPRFGKRGDRLLSVDEMLADVASPMESLIKTANAMARDRGFGDLVESAKSRWMNTYGEDFALKDQDGIPTFPGTEDFLDKSKRFDPNYQKALSTYRYIRHNLESIDSNREWKSSMIHLASWLDSKGDMARPLAKYIQENVGENGNPISLLRSLAFHMFIAANPVRQVLLQSQQFLFISTANPLLAPKAMSKKPLLDMGMAVIDRPAMMAQVDKIPESAFKASGFESKKEWLETVRAFKEGGMPYSIDSHSFTRDAVGSLENAIASNPVSTAINKTMRVAGAPLRIAKTVGFDFGEYNNLSTTWLLARERFISKTGKKPKHQLDWDEIGADARQLGLSMTPSGSFKYQQGGIASLMTQFLSIQHKAFLAMLPGKYGSKAFTGREKFGIAVGQFAFWGAGGFGLSAAYEAARDKFGFDLDPGWDAALAHGSAELIINNVLTDITGERQDVALEGFAAAGGMYDTALNWGMSLITGVGSPLEIAPAYSAVSRLNKVTRLLHHTMNVPEIDNEEKLSRAIKVIGMYTSGGSQYLRGAAAQKYGHYVSTSGNFVAQATYEEAMVHKWIGLNSREVEDYYKIQSSGPRSDIRMKALQDIADEMFTRTRQSVTLLSNEGDFSSVPFDMLEESVQTEAIILTALPPNDAQEVVRMFRSKMAKDHTETKVDSLLSKMVQGAMRNNYGTDVDSVISELKYSKMITNPEQEAMVRKLMEYVHQHVDLTKEEE